MEEIQIHSRNVYENCEKAVLQCYVQTRSKKLTMPPRPAVVIFPGGGYDYTSDREAEPVANAYLAAGYSAFVVRYAVGADARHPHPLLDAAAAIALLRARAEEFHIDPQKIAVCGFSAGGHLAAHIGTQWHLPLLRDTLGCKSEDFRPNAMVLGYPVISATRGGHLYSFLNLTGPDPSHEQLHALSVDENVDERTPPAFLWHTADDTWVFAVHSLLMAGALARAGVKAELHVFPKGNHSLSVCTRETAGGGNPDRIYPYVGRWIPWSVEFLENVFYGGDFHETFTIDS